MALTINDIHTRVNYLIKKNKWGYTSPQDIDVCLDMAQMDLFNHYYGSPNQYQYGRPIPPVAHGQNQKLHDSLSPFLKTLVLSGADGFTQIPTDYIHLDSAYIADSSTNPVTYIPLKLVSNDKVAFRQNSQLMPARDTSDFLNAFISMTPDLSDNRGIQIYPREAPTVALAYYLSRPEAPLFSYTQTGRVITWVELSSVNLNWSDDDTIKIIQMTIQYIGMQLENDRLFQQGQIKAKE